MLIIGLGGGLAFAEGSKNINRRECQRWSSVLFWRYLSRSLWIGLLFGLALGVLGSLGDISVIRVIVGLVFGLSLGLGGALASGVMSGWKVSILSLRTTPMQGLYSSIKTGLVAGLIAGVAFGLGFGLVIALGGLLFGSSFFLVFGLQGGMISGLILGLGIGLLLGIESFTQHNILRFVLAHAGLFPFRAVTFLDDMSAHLLLERDGAFYRFRHRLLRDFIAALDDAELVALADLIKRKGV
jgi:hypothetical protein